MKMNRRAMIASFSLSLLPLLTAGPQALGQSAQQQLVNEAAGVVNSFYNPGTYNVRGLVRRSRAVLIVPNLVKAGLIFGGQGGKGVLLVHQRDGNWSYPAFYNLGAATFGLQAGLSMSKVVLIIMNDRALRLTIDNSELKLGTDVGPVVATLGAGAAGHVTRADADIYAVSNSEGLFGGVTVQGGALGPTPDWDAAYYGRPISTREIVYGRAGVAQPGANYLRRALGRL